MTLSELVRTVAQLTGNDPDEVGAILETAVTVMASRLRRGEGVKIQGLGTFHWQYRKKSRRKNPKTGEWVEVPEKYVLRFKPVQKLKHMEVD